MSEPERDGVDPLSPRGAELRTFLIADIRGYTKFTRERGDEAGAALTRQFATLVQAAVTAHEGTLVELRGDEALAVFVSPRQALRTALAIQEAVAAAGLPGGVGIGLDAGEAIPVDGGYRGSALNLAARLCGRAGPGEVIASESVIHVAAHVDGIAYVNPRSVRVKGFSDPVRTVNVIAGRDAREGPRPLLDRVKGGVFHQGRRSVAIAGAAVLAGIVLVVASASLLQRAPAVEPTPGTSRLLGGIGTVGPSPIASLGAPTPRAAASPSIASSIPAATPDALATRNLPLLVFLDPATGDVLDTLPLSKPGDMSTFFDGSFWILGFKPSALYEIDPTSHQIVQTIDVPVEHDGGFAFADGTIWVGDNDAPRVVGIDARTGARVHDFRLTKDPKDTDGVNGIAVGAGSIWAVRGNAGDILRADEKTGAPQASIPIQQPDAVAFNGDALWVTGGGTLTRIDPVTNEATLEPALAPQHFMPFMAWDGSAAWTANPDQGLVFRVGRDGQTRTFQTGRGAGPLAYEAGQMWVANRDAGSISGIDVNTGQVRTVPLGHIPGSMAAGAAQLMVAVSATPEEEIAALPGPTLVIANNGDPLHNPTPDPAVNTAWDFRTLEFATCASLMAYPDTAGIEGLQLHPEVAAAPPDISADQLTYTFRIRPGYAFSPPSNAPVTAETFRFSIERALSGKLGDQTRGIEFLSDVAGAQDFHDGKVANVSGLKASGDTLTIRLIRPDPSLLTQLAYPTFCPVPLGTPAVEGGVAPDQPLPSAGPYYLSADLDGLVVLTKNPNYPGERPQSFQNIAELTGLDAGDTIARVNSGTADVALATNDPVLSDGSDIAHQWGPGSQAATAGDQRFFLGPVPGVDYLALDSQRGIFTDPDIRRAAWLAIDRAAIASAWPESPTDHLLPTASAYSGTPPSVPGPQVAEAMALMNGRHSTAIFAVPPRDQCPACTTIANTVKSDLAQIGITVKVQEKADVNAAANARSSKIDIVYLYSQDLIVDPIGLLGLMVHQDVPASWLPADVVARVDEINLETGAQRDAGATALAKRLDTDELLLLPFGAATATAYVSPKLGSAFIQPGWYKLDLVALRPR